MGRSLSEEVSELEVLNAAGEWLVGAHTWTWQIRPAASVDFAAGVTYAVLPTDFAEALGVERNTLTASFGLTTLAQIERLRAKSFLASTEFMMWGAIAFGAGSQSAPPTVRLELYPTPTDNVTAALKIPYRAGWSRLTTVDTQYVQIPDFMETLYLEAARRLAVSWEKSTDAGETLTALLVSTIFTSAVQRDARHQMDLGPITNGAVRRTNGLVPNTVPWTVVVT